MPSDQQLEDDETRITPQMMEAGSRIFAEVFDQPSDEVTKMIAAQVFRAMLDSEL